MPKQKQKQKQTVIVNIGDKVVKKKQKRRRKPRAPPRAPPPAPQTGFPDFIRTVMPTASNIQTDKVLFQLADVTRQLETLQEKQKHATGNLMAGKAAIAREEADKPPAADEPPAADKPPAADEPPVIKSPPKSGRRSKAEKQEAEAMGLEDKPKRTYVSRQTKAEEAAELLFRQGGMLRGSGPEPSLAGFESGTVSSLTMTPGLMTPQEQVIMIKPRKKGSKSGLSSVSETPSTASLSGFTFGSASAETAPNF